MAALLIAEYRAARAAYQNACDHESGRSLCIARDRRDKLAVELADSIADEPCVIPEADTSTDHVCDPNPIECPTCHGTPTGVTQSATAETNALDAIAAVMSGTEWDADTLDTIAAIARETGRVIADVNDDEEEEHEEGCDCAECFRRVNGYEPPADHSMAKEDARNEINDGERPTVLVLRDPDEETFVRCDRPIRLVSIDLGSSFDGLDDITSLGTGGAEEWVTDLLAQVEDLPTDNVVRREVEDIAAQAREIIAGARQKQCAKCGGVIARPQLAGNLLERCAPCSDDSRRPDRKANQS